jgi:hypothetical protein
LRCCCNGLCGFWRGGLEGIAILRLCCRYRRSHHLQRVCFDKRLLESRSIAVLRPTPILGSQDRIMILILRHALCPQVFGSGLCGTTTVRHRDQCFEHCASAKTRHVASAASAVAARSASAASAVTAASASTAMKAIN